VLKRCLEKDPKKRLRDISGVELLLETPEISQEASRPRPPTLLWKGLVAAPLVALLGLSFVHFREAPPKERLLRYTIAAPETSAINSFAISPDGRSVAIAAILNGKRQLWIRPLDALEARPLPATDGATYPFWSPDSRFIAFFAQNKLRKIAAAGGPPQSLCDAGIGRGGSWSRDDIIVFSPSGSPGDGLQAVPAAGGVPVSILKTTNVARFPVFLPDGRHFLYQLASASRGTNGVYVASLDGKENRRVLADESTVAFAPPAARGGLGHLLFLRENTLLGQPFDALNARTVGDVFPVAEGISFFDLNNLAPITVSENGVLLYSTGGGAANEIILYNRGGTRLGPVGAPGSMSFPSISPDQKMVLFGRGSGGARSIWKRDLINGADTRLTSGPQEGNPIWSPRGDAIAYVNNQSGFRLYRKPASGSGPEELLLSTTGFFVPHQWSMDSRFIVYTQSVPTTQRDVFVLPVPPSPGDGKPIAFLHSEFNEIQGQLSPDSRWMAYTSDESGQREVYLQPFPAANNKRRISVAGGEQPRWRRDGKELFFVAGNGSMMAASVNIAKDSLEIGALEPLFETHMLGLGVNVAFSYDVTADGKQFLVNTTADAGSAPLTVMINWISGFGK
jgi:Tol biopolymer transport system component